MHCALHARMITSIMGSTHVRPSCTHVCVGVSVCVEGVGVAGYSFQFSMRMANVELPAR